MQAKREALVMAVVQGGRAVVTTLELEIRRGLALAWVPLVAGENREMIKRGQIGFAYRQARESGCLYFLPLLREKLTSPMNAKMPSRTASQRR